MRILALKISSSARAAVLFPLLLLGVARGGEAMGKFALIVRGQKPEVLERVEMGAIGMPAAVHSLDPESIAPDPEVTLSSGRF